MNLFGFLRQRPAFTTRQFAHAQGVSLSSASRKLKTLSQGASAPLVAVTRGVWAQPQHASFTPYGLVPLLLGNEQGYISLLSALQRHGVISQIPQVIQVATTGHGRKLECAAGSYEFFHFDSRMIRGGMEWLDLAMPYGLATAEKALLDALYLSVRKGRRFSRFPELDLSVLEEKKFMALLRAQVTLGVLRKAILKKWESLRG